MGDGSWRTESFDTYTKKTKGVTADAFATSASVSTQDVFTRRSISPVLNPKNVMRLCLDTKEHPNTIPVIIGIDVTGSMGAAAVKVARKINDIITGIYAKGDIKDIEFCIMGIGDIGARDEAPIQISQFESDIRIAEQLDEIYFEGRGGGNKFESYTAAWYMGLYHCTLDCWKRGKKGIIITLGDELPNPYLPKSIGLITEGKDLQEDIQTTDIYKEVIEKFEVYHISVDDGYTCYEKYNRLYKEDDAWSNLITKDNYKVSTLDQLADTIIDIIKKHATGNDGNVVKNNGEEYQIENNDVISW